MSKESALQLAQDHGETYRRQGWVVIEDYLTSRDVEVVREQVEDVIDATVAGRNATLPYYESEAADARLVRIESFWEEVPCFASGPIGAQLHAFASELLGCEAKLFKDKVNFRYSETPGYAPHQDTAAGWLDFGERFVSICLFLEKTETRVGGFEIASGVHRQGRFRNTIGKMFDEDFEKLDIEGIAAEPGSALVIDGETPHRTLANTSDTASRHLIISFVASDRPDPRTDYYRAKRSQFESREGGGLKFKVFEKSPNADDAAED